eukprot:Tbor_TRINITY_DN3235_c0_g1::TRINITY_DN3235_c0_g1_i1::g.23791::m.23791/K17550/PPP1R7, SDS22; protein phosphatase 1 regulatory subunit 7
MSDDNHATASKNNIDLPIDHGDIVVEGKSKPDKKKAFAKMFAESIAIDSHQPQNTYNSSTLKLNANNTDLDDDDDDNEVAPPNPPKKNEAEEAHILHVKVDEESIEINNVRLFSFDEVALSRFTNCTELEMRKNLIHNLDPPFPVHLANNLLILDLFDNKIRKIPAGFFDTFTSLIKLDLSYNQIKKIENLGVLGNTLCELYLVENRIKEICNLHELKNLRLLELGGNKIRHIGDGLDNLTNLTELWLGKNKINILGTSFNKLKSLKRLSLQANRLLEITTENFPLGANPCLEELYLSENGLTTIDNVRYLPKIRLLDYSFNPIQKINSDEININTMPVLEEFWLTDGRLDSWEEVDKLKPFEKTMYVAYFERNPIEQDKRYRDKVFMALPFLKQIDSWPVVNRNNLEGDRAIHRR